MLHIHRWLFGKRAFPAVWGHQCLDLVKIALPNSYIKWVGKMEPSELKPLECWCEFNNYFCKCQRFQENKRPLLVGGWTNPFEKYDRQNGSFPQFSGWKFQKYLKPPTSLWTGCYNLRVFASHPLGVKNIEVTWNRNLTGVPYHPADC